MKFVTAAHASERIVLVAALCLQHGIQRKNGGGAYADEAGTWRREDRAHAVGC